MVFLFSDEIQVHSRKLNKYKNTDTNYLHTILFINLNMSTNMEIHYRKNIWCTPLQNP